MKGYPTNILKSIIFFITGFLLLFSFNASAQKKNESYQLRIHRAVAPVKVDGSIDDEAWRQADSAHSFYMVLPMDTSYARVKTEVKMCYDDYNLYLIAICHKFQAGHYFVESLRRDF